METGARHDLAISAPRQRNAGVGAFLILHLGDHLWGVAFGPQAHDTARLTLRAIYGQPVAKILLALAVLLQTGSGILLLRHAKIDKAKGVRRVQLWPGLVLAGFLVIHVSAAAMTRLAGQTTDFGFASAGVQDPFWRLFFIPYYALPVVTRCPLLRAARYYALPVITRCPFLPSLSTVTSACPACDTPPVLWRGDVADGVVATLILGLMAGAFHEFDAPAFRLPGLIP